MNKSKILDFYADVCTSVNLVTDKEGYIKAEGIDGGKDIKMSINEQGKLYPMVLPTPDNCKNLFSPDDKGNLAKNHSLFNPLKEDMLKDGSPSLRKLKMFIDVNTCMTLGATVLLLLKLVDNKTKQNKAKLHIQSIISNLTEAIKNNRKSTVDPTTIDKWQSLMEKSNIGSKATNSLAHFYVKKGGKLNGETYVKLATMGFPLLELFDKVDKERNVLGVKLRQKDIDVFRILIKNIFADLDIDDENYLDKMILSVGVNDTESPGFVAMYKLYLIVMNRLNSILDDLKFIDDEGIIDSIKTELPIDIKDLDNIERFASELDVIPDDGINTMSSTSATDNINKKMHDAKNSMSITKSILYNNGNEKQMHIPTVATPKVEQVNMSNNNVSTVSMPAKVEQQQNTPTSSGGSISRAILEKDKAAMAMHSYNNNPFNTIKSAGGNPGFGNQGFGNNNYGGNPFGGNHQMQQNFNVSNPYQQNNMNNGPARVM